MIWYEFVSNFGVWLMGRPAQKRTIPSVEPFPSPEASSITTVILPLRFQKVRTG